MDNIKILDGAMGTEFQKLGISYEEMLFAPIYNKEAIKEIQRKYICSGSRGILTPTFGALELLALGKGKEFKEVLESAIRLSTEVIEAYPEFDIKLIISFGPTATRISREEYKKLFKELIKYLSEFKFDYLLLETQYDFKIIAVAIEVLGKSKIPFMISISLNNEGNLVGGEGVKEICNLIKMVPLSAIGFNCINKNETMLKALEYLSKSVNIPIIAKPNLGKPKRDGDRLVYGMNDDEFEKYCEEILALGVTYIGGCCGTTPRHIKIINKIIR